MTVLLQNVLQFSKERRLCLAKDIMGLRSKNVCKFLEDFWAFLDISKAIPQILMKISCLCIRKSWQVCNHQQCDCPVCSLTCMPDEQHRPTFLTSIACTLKVCMNNQSKCPLSVIFLLISQVMISKHWKEQLHCAVHVTCQPNPFLFFHIQIT